MTIIEDYSFIASTLVIVASWVWQAARYSAKVNGLEALMNDHIEKELSIWHENQDGHDKIIEKLEALDRTLAYVKGRTNINGDLYKHEK